MGASFFGRHIFGRFLSLPTPLPGIGHDEVFALHDAGEMRRTQRKMIIREEPCMHMNMREIVDIQNTTPQEKKIGVYF